MLQFQTASGSVMGREHAKALHPNQDALAMIESDDRLILVVADGCSSGVGGVSHNEVGAQLGARATAVILQYNAGWTPDALPYWPGIKRAALDYLRACVLGLSTGRQPDKEVVLDLFLFTLVVAVIGPRVSTFASIGDGVIYVNGTRIPWGPYPGNEPPYLAYGLTGTRAPELLDFQIHASVATEDLSSFLIGTDGVNDLVHAADATMPGIGAPVGPLSRLWTHDGFFANPYALGRYLTLVNGGVRHLYPGLLPDDTTLIVGRRRA